MNDRLYLIDIDGIEEEVRCTICKNQIKTDKGCDGNCKYDESLFRKITTMLDRRIELLPYAPPKSYADSSNTINRMAAINVVEGMRAYIGHNMERAVGRAVIEILDEVGKGINDLPPAPEPVITHEQAVDYLQSTGWMQEHDRQMMLDGVHRLTAQPEPHWIPVTEPPKSDFMPYYATCRSKVDDRENWVIEGMYTKYSGWEYPPMVRDDRAEIIAWMPKELPEPYKGVTE